MSDEEFDLEKADGDSKVYGCCCSLVFFPLLVVGAFYLIRFLLQRLEQNAASHMRGFEVILPTNRPVEKKGEQKERD